VTATSLLLQISALGIFIHSFFLSISLGFPWVIVALLFKWWRTRENEYYEAARNVTGVLGLNFALGAITGTLVEFGLVQAWPGSIFVIATFGLIPLTLELVAFIGEIVLLVMFIVTLGKVRALASLGIMMFYGGMAILSGVLIMTVNSWLNVPWGTGDLSSSLYPFLPQYGSSAVNPSALVKLKLELVKNLLATGTASQILQNPGLAKAVGLTLTNPYVALSSPYALASALHAVNAGIIVGISFAVVGYAYRFMKTGQAKYVRIVKSFLPILLVLLILQPTVIGDMMGKAVAFNQPTKFALMEAAANTTQNPPIAFLAYGNPQHPIIGFDTLRSQCNSLGDTTLGNIAASAAPNMTLGSASSVQLKSVCLSDLSKSESRLPVIYSLYYAKIVFGIMDLIAIVGLFALSFNLGPFSRLAKRILNRFGEHKSMFLLSLLVVLASILASGLGWFVREDGRKPWTVYGLLYPEELITSVPIGPVFILFAILFVAVAAIGIYGIYVVSTRRLKFVELLKKGGGVE
jgi:cytochrome d ubiquinol oxidase subunit I